MSDSGAAGEEKLLTEDGGGGDRELPVPSDDEDDCEGYFLEPVGCTINISEKIAEANKKLLEEEEIKRESDDRPRKVQFSEDLVNYEPIYYSDEEYTESAQNSVISEEDLEIKLNQDEFENVKSEDDPGGNVEKNSEHKSPEDDILEDIVEDVHPNVSVSEDIPEDANERNPKFILVLLSKDQNSSCESIIGEDIPEEKKTVDKSPEIEKLTKAKIARPKSAKKSCEVSKISPNLSCSSTLERKSWGVVKSPLGRPKGKLEGREKKNAYTGEIKVQIKGRYAKKINIGDLSLDDVSRGETLKRCGSRPMSCYRGKGNPGADGVESRPKSAPLRTCCVIKAELPSYNGLRSEYGLTEEQLQERKQRALESRQQKKQEQLRQRQEEMKRRNENEETFQRWLFNKTKKNYKKKSAKPMDTLTRSDVYIQTHASYAASRSVPYSLDYSITRKASKRRREAVGKKSKTVFVEKLLEKSSPHLKRSFNIYLGIK